MSATPLSTTQERVERSIYERIRLELVDKGYLPDITLYNSNTALNQTDWEAAMATIRTTMGFCIELFGAGSYEKNDDKKVPRIVIDSGFFSEGTLGGDQTTYFQLADDNLSYEAYKRPPQASQLDLNIHVVASSTKEIRIAQSILGLALQTRGYLPLYTEVPNEIQETGNFFYRRAGVADLPQTEEGVIEKVYRYVIDDVYEVEPTPLDSASIITEITLDVDPGDPVVINLQPSCAPVEFYINSFLVGELLSGSVKNLQVKDQNGNQVGSLVGDEWIVNVGGGGSSIAEVTNSNSTINITFDTADNPYELPDVSVDIIVNGVTVDTWTFAGSDPDPDLTLDF